MNQGGFSVRGASRVGRALLSIVAATSLITVSTVALLAAAPGAGADTTATIVSDQLDYAPGSTVILTGSGWQPAESVQIVVNDTAGQSWQWTDIATTDVGGAFTDSVSLPSYFVANYSVTATGNQLDSASTTFTDSPVKTYDQCSNDTGTGYTTGDDGCRWISGDINPSNSLYSEGDTTPQRLWLTGLEPGSTHTLELTYGTTRNGKHAYDFLTTWNKSEPWITDADRCQDITGCTTAGPDSTLDIPADPNVSNTFQPSAPGDRQFVLRGGSLTTATTPAISSGSYAANSETSISVSFTVGTTGSMCSTDNKGDTTCDIALWFGGHIAAQANWGVGLGAGSISGSPYHIALDQFDNGAVGQRDNQMQSAVIPQSGSLTLSKTLTGGPAGYTGPFTIHYNCGGTLSGDVSVSAGSSQSVSGLPAGASCTVTEPTLPTVPSYSFGAPTFSPSNATVTILNGQAVEVVTHNTLTRDTGTLTIKKTLSNPDGATVPSTYSISYNCGTGYTGSVSVAAGSSKTVAGIPTGSSCTVSEAAPTAISGYTWATPTYTPASVTIATTTGTYAITVANAIARNRGTLTIKKTLSNPDGATVPSTYSISYNCGVGYTGSVSVAAGGTKTVAGIPTGSSCTVSEAALTPIAGYTWATPTYTPTSIVIATTTGTYPITVANSITRNRGTLTIKKTLSNPNGATVPSSYSVSYNCGTGYTGSVSVAAGSSKTVAGIPTGNTCTVSEAALTPIAGYTWATPTYTPTSIVIGTTTGTFAITVANSIVRDSTPPACALTATIAGPPTQIQVTVSDAGSGLKSIVVTISTNESVVVPAFAVGTKSPVVVKATKTLQSQASQLALQVTDVAGNITKCDPVVLNSTGPHTSWTITDAASAEHVVTVMNGTPGVSVVTVAVNGKLFPITGLAAGETRSIDIGSALLAGSANTIKVTSNGSSKGAATVLIWDGD